MPKTYAQEPDGSVTVTETFIDAKGIAASRTWWFRTLADAAAQRAEFESVLTAAQKTTLDAVKVAPAELVK